MRRSLVVGVVAVLTLGSLVSQVQAVAEVEPHGTWVDVGPMPNRRANPVAVRLRDGRVLVAGGETKWDAGCKRNAVIFNPATNEWTKAGRMHRERCGATAVRLGGGRVLVVGGQGLTDRSKERFWSRSEIYLPHRDRWIRTSPMPVPRGWAIAERIGAHRVLVTGGACRGSCSSAFIYHSRRDSWTRTAPMNVPRVDGSSVRLGGGNILVAGGPSNPEGLRTAQRYSVARGTWRAAGRFAGTYSPLLFRTGSGDVQAIPNSYRWTQREVHRFDPTTNDWSLGSLLPVPRAEPQVVPLRGRAFVLGGWYATRTALLWRPAAREWVRWTRIPQPVMSHAAVKLRDGSILVLGGQTELGEGTHVPRKLAYRYYP